MCPIIENYYWFKSKVSWQLISQVRRLCSAFVSVPGMKNLPRNLACRSWQHFKSLWMQLTALLMISKSHVRTIWGTPSLFFLFNWAAFSNFGMNNVRPSVNVQCYTKKQTQSLPIDNNGCCVFHDYRWCPKYVPSSAEKNMSESWEFCENRTDSILVLNLGTSCLCYFRTMNHTGASTCFHSSLLLLRLKRHTSRFNGFFLLLTPEKEEKYKQTRWFKHY